MQRMQETGLNPGFFKHHLQALDYGMPPHAGWTIWLERLMMILIGKKNIQEVTLYPRDRVRLTYLDPVQCLGFRNPGSSY